MLQPNFLPLISTWIDGTTYVSAGHGFGVLILWLTSGEGLYYEGVPSWVRGLLHAGTTNGKSNSSGRAYNALVKGRYVYTPIAADQRFRVAS